MTGPQNLDFSLSSQHVVVPIWLFERMARSYYGEPPAVPSPEPESPPKTEKNVEVTPPVSPSGMPPYMKPKGAAKGAVRTEEASDGG